jgi:hypothetical protein
VDDTFTFCLDDGALLSALSDLQSTLQIPAARDTEPPRTEILRFPLTPGDSHSSPQPATPQAFGSFRHPQQAVAEPLPQKRSGNAKIIVGVVIGLLTAGVLLLGYMLWRGNQNGSSEVAKSDSNVQANNAVVTRDAPTNTGTNVNAAGVVSPTPASSPSSQWLEGVWEGTGYQKAPKMTWSIKFIAAAGNTYVIQYPSLRCVGKWTLVEMGADRATFKETIVNGLDRCSTGGDVLIEKIGDSQVSYKYTLPMIGEVATATLSKRAVP